MTPFDVLHDIVQRRRQGKADGPATLRALDQFDTFLAGFERELGSLQAPGASSAVLKAQGESSLALFRQASASLRHGVNSNSGDEEVSALAAAREGWAIAQELMRSTASQ